MDFWILKFRETKVVWCELLFLSIYVKAIAKFCWQESPKILDSHPNEWFPFILEIFAPWSKESDYGTLFGSIVHRPSSSRRSNQYPVFMPFSSSVVLTWFCAIWTANGFCWTCYHYMQLFLWRIEVNYFVLRWCHVWLNDWHHHLVNGLFLLLANYHNSPTKMLYAMIKQI